MDTTCTRRRLFTHYLPGSLLLVSPFAAIASRPGEADAATISGVKGTVNAGGGLNFRTRASTSAPIIKNLPYGTRVNIIGTNGDWFKINVSGKNGYVNSWYITLIGTASTVINRGNTSRKMVALTFDAGSDLGYTDQILTVLENYGITASFGLTGTWVSAYPDYARWVVDAGHQVLNHTLQHPSYTGASTGAGALCPSRRLSQIIANEERTASLTGGASKPYWRPPYGDIDSGVLRDVGAIGYRRTVMWSIDSMGWDGYSSSAIYNRVINNTGNGSIVLMHVGAASQDGVALERIIKTLRSRGFAFGTVAQVIA